MSDPDEVVEVLDVGYLPDGCGVMSLLDGNGNKLPKDAEPVFVKVKRIDVIRGVARNSAGQYFNPWDKN